MCLCFSQLQLLLVICHFLHMGFVPHAVCPLPYSLLQSQTDGSLLLSLIHVCTCVRVGLARNCHVPPVTQRPNETALLEGPVSSCALHGGHWLLTLLSPPTRSGDTLCPPQFPGLPHHSTDQVELHALHLSTLLLDITRAVVVPSPLRRGWETAAQESEHRVFARRFAFILKAPKDPPPYGWGRE